METKTSDFNLTNWKIPMQFIGETNESYSDMINLYKPEFGSERDRKVSIMRSYDKDNYEMYSGCSIKRTIAECDNGAQCDIMFVSNNGFLSEDQLELLKKHIEKTGHRVTVSHEFEFETSEIHSQT